MALLLPIAVFVLLVVSFMATNSFRLSVIKSALTIGAVTFLLTELLSVLGTLHYWGIVAGWSVLLAGIFLVVWRRKPFVKGSQVLVNGYAKIKLLTKWQKMLVACMLLLLLALFIQGVVYPSNNWDAMSYHMARVVHWIQNGSLEHYRTPHYAQLISPPLAEVSILNSCVLTGADYLANAVQWLSLVGCLLLGTMLAKTINLKRTWQLMTALIMLTLPEGVLLASSTHTELVASFFLLSTIFFLVRTHQGKKISDFVFLGLSIGLGLATKSTMFIYLSPFVVCWFMVQLYQVLTHQSRLQLKFYLILVGIVVLVNFGHYSRNYRLTGNLFGTNEEIHNYYVNEQHSLTFFVSNVVRNVSLQFGVPHVATSVQHKVQDLHTKMGVSVNESAITSHTYGVDPLATHENNGANLFHTLVLMVCFIWFIWRIKKHEKSILVFTGCIVLSFLLFCFYLKWQPWAKLHAPFYILYAVFMAYALNSLLKKKWMSRLMVIGFAVTGLIYTTYNYSRPLITHPPFTSEIKWSDVRSKKYFSRFLEYHHDYQEVKQLIQKKGFKTVGLALKKHEMEYQLFNDTYTSDVRPVHLNAHPICAAIPIQTLEIDCIVSTEIKDSIQFNGKEFFNATKDNDGYLALYLFEEN